MAVIMLQLQQHGQREKHLKFCSVRCTMEERDNGCQSHGHSLILNTAQQVCNCGLSAIDSLWSLMCLNYFKQCAQNQTSSVHIVGLIKTHRLCLQKVVQLWSKEQSSLSQPRFVFVGVSPSVMRLHFCLSVCTTTTYIVSQTQVELLQYEQVPTEQGSGHGHLTDSLTHHSYRHTATIQLGQTAPPRQGPFSHRLSSNIQFNLLLKK